MACYNPVHGYRGEGGRLTLAHRPDLNTMSVPCGYCIGCRMDRAKDWAVRCYHEASMHSENSFITLTYSNEHLPPGGSLQKTHYQEFMRELRRHYSPKTIRYFHCGEYGDKFRRPHYHACIFGHDFEDKTLWKESTSGNHLYRSKTLETLWPFGHSSIGEVTWESAGYVARYINKKIVGTPAEEHYQSINSQTGEHESIQPEYVTMSNRPGIGRSWFEKYWQDVYPGGFVVINTGKRTQKVKPPRYYDKLLAEIDPQLLEEQKILRIDNSKLHEADNTEDRLRVRQFVHEQKVKKLIRKLDSDI